MSKPINAIKQKKAKDFLKSKGIKADKVDKLKMDTEEDVIKSMLDLHGISYDQYKGGAVG